MSDFEQLLRGDELNLPRPCNPIAFRRQLSEICRGHGVEVRLAWSVDLNRCIFGGRIFKKYGIKTWRERLLGHLICIPDIFGTIVIHGQRYRKIRYDPPTRMLSGAPAIKLPGEIALPDMVIEENVFSRWMLEWRMPDELAKPQHESQRYAVVDGQKLDVLGEFPPEGCWKCFMIIGEHGNGDCCRHFEPLQVCIGRYKHPDESDLEEVRKAIWARNQIPKYRDVSDPPTQREIEQAIRDLEYEMQQADERNTARIIDEIKEEIGTHVYQHFSPLIDVGGAAKKAMTNGELLAASKEDLGDGYVKACQCVD